MRKAVDMLCSLLFPAAGLENSDLGKYDVDHSPQPQTSRGEEKRSQKGGEICRPDRDSQIASFSSFLPFCLPPVRLSEVTTTDTHTQEGEESLIRSSFVALGDRNSWERGGKKCNGVFLCLFSTPITEGNSFLRLPRGARAIRRRPINAEMLFNFRTHTVHLTTNSACSFDKSNARISSHTPMHDLPLTFHARAVG